MDDRMSMTIHAGNREFIVFKFWKTGSAFGLVASVVIIVLMCIFFESLKALRVFLARLKRLERQEIERTTAVNIPDASSDRIETTSNDALNFPPLLKFTRNGKIFTRYRLFQAFLYAVQALLAYILMLIVMTFNIWLLTAVVIGEAVGYFLFTGEPLIIEPNHCC